MKQRIGVIGAKGDLGSQLVVRLQNHGHTVLQCTKDQANGNTITSMLHECGIVHVCAPLGSLRGVQPGRAVVVLHDSVMAASRQAGNQYLGGQAAVVHMLMNDTQTVVVASDAPHSQLITAHLREIGLSPRAMTIAEHDYLMARSQAPLALLCKTLLPFLDEQDGKGLLTPSGQLLAATLRARELAWTDETIRSILRNPQLPRLIKDMRAAMAENQK